MKKMMKVAAVFVAMIMALSFVGCSAEDDDEDETASLSEGIWANGRISEDGQTKKYTFTVTKGMRYFIYMNNAWDGDETKDGYTGMEISHSDGTVICDWYYNARSCWSKPVTFSASSNGTITITVASCSASGWVTAAIASNWEHGTGTYAIKYTSRPEYTALQNVDDWHDDDIIAEGQINEYRFDVTGGTRYFVYMNNAWDGDETKTGYTGMKISHSDGTVICDWYYDARSCWSEPVAFAASSNGTITITVASCSASGWVTAAIASNWEHGTGTYAIKYTIAVSDNN